ncbi:MAG: type 1 glutamine amidotransferase domain-containing protein [Thiohalomonadaceae bacterium]
MKKIAVFVHDVFNEVELWVPYYRLLEEGYDIKIIGAGNKKDYASAKGLLVTADLISAECIDEDFHGVIIPGGYAPDKMRTDGATLEIVKKAFVNRRLIAAICHGPWVLASADVLKGKKLTCVKNIKDDVINAGGEYLDQEVVVDDNLVTSRAPVDLPAFCREIVKILKSK